MSDEMKKKVLDEIHKIGYPLEFKVAELLSKYSYNVAHSTYYIDREENKSREIDIRAISDRVVNYKHENFYISNVLTIECKKTENKPWIFLSSKFHENDTDLSNLISNLKNDVNFDEYFELELEKIHPFLKNNRRGRSYFEAFKNNSSEQIFKAVTSSVKAIIYQQDILEKIENRLAYYYPCIVYEGEMFEGVMLNGDIHVEPVDIVYLSFKYDSPIYGFLNFTVPVIKFSYLEEFIQGIDESLDLTIDNIVDV